MVSTRCLTGDVEPVYDIYGDIAYYRTWGGKNAELMETIGWLPTTDESTC